MDEGKRTCEIMVTPRPSPPTEAAVAIAVTLLRLATLPRRVVIPSPLLRLPPIVLGLLTAILLRLRLALPSLALPAIRIPPILLRLRRRVTTRRVTALLFLPVMFPLIRLRLRRSVPPRRVSAILFLPIMFPLIRLRLRASLLLLVLATLRLVRLLLIPALR